MKVCQYKYSKQFSTSHVSFEFMYISLKIVDPKINKSGLFYTGQVKNTNPNPELLPLLVLKFDVTKWKN